jgi:two-component system OmpR family sensor kinase
MGRLFWKFFFFFWLAQFVTVLVVGVAFWSFEEKSGHPPHGAPPGIDWPPPPPHDAEHADHFRHPPPHPPPPIMPIIAGSLVSLLFAALLAWYFSRPIRNLRLAFDAVAGGKLETRIGAAMGRRNDELADLGNDFDRMAERLQSLLDTQRRLLHDVSHELRSPLARLQAAADLMRQQPERSTEFIDHIERDTARMDRLIGELLTLARLNAGMADLPDEAVDLAELIGDIADDARLEAETRCCTIALDLNAGATLRGSNELLSRAIENVVRNAIRHSPKGSIVEVATRTSEEHIYLTIADQGPGVPDSDLATIFDPFFRGGPSQSDGYGLGLAITRRVIEAHGGQVFAENRPVAGLLVTLELPCKRD